MKSESFRTSGVLADINVTPMVDVMLVLLVIFMIVTPALLAGFQGQLPRGVNLKSRQDDPNRVELGIDADGNYYLDKHAIRKQDAATLLAQDFARHPQDRVLFVKADRRLKYGEILKAMAMARAAGARVIAAVTEKEQGQETKHAPVKPTRVHRR